MPMDKQQYGEPITSPEIRVQYPAFEEPDTGHKFSTGEYGFRALLPKTSKKGLKRMLNTLVELAGVKSADDLEKNPFCDKKNRLHDGDSEKNKAKEGHPGHIFFNLSSKNPIKTYIIGEDGEPEICDPSEIYAGCYVVCVMTPAVYGELETTYYPNSVMKVREGAPFKTTSGTDTKSLLSSWAKDNADTVEKKKAKPADEDEAPVTKKKKAKVVEPEDDDEDSSDSDDEDEDEAPKKKAGKRGRPKGSVNKAKKSSKVVDEDDDEDEPADEDDDDEDEAPVTKAKKKAKVVEDEDDEDEPVDDDEDEPADDDDEDEEPAPKKKKKTINDLFD